MLSARATAKLLERVRHHLDAEITRQMACPVYVLGDGGALIVFEDGKGTHWLSYEELLANHRASVKRAEERRDPLLDVLPDSERFRTGALAMAAELPPLLGLKPE